ncbi:MAG TPA: ABC transporter ATP-binding protein [Gammaproteobacteria bacterium]|nr:ABC transporter ATP-binding protein [Gammaproteobacteria bacterium]
MTNVVEVQGLSRQFGTTKALDAVDFRATEGLVHGLVGVNGAGKTTLIKHLLGLLRPTSGTVRVLGLDPVRDPVNVLRRVGYLSEQREMPEWMRIDELLRYTQAYYPSWDMRYARELLDTFGLDAKKKVGGLSQGMRAQTGLVLAVAHRPQVLILDEPSSGLDAVVRQDILDAIVRTVADEGRTVIFSSHLLDEVERMSDRVTMIHQGKIALDGMRDDVCGAHHVTQLRFAERLDRLPPLDGVLTASGGARSWSVVHAGPVERLRDAAGSVGGEISESRNATLEEIFVARVGRGAPRAEAA